MRRVALLMAVAACASAQVTPPSGPRTEQQAKQASFARRDRQLIALGVAGTGGAAILLSGVLGLDALSLRDDARELGCVEDLSQCPRGKALETAESAYGRGQVATGFFVGGAVAIAVGVWLWTRVPDAPPSWRVAPSVDDRGGTVTVGREF
jgi:hypothetical protein